MTQKRILVFGASGTLGTACANELRDNGFEIIPVARDLSILENIGQIDGSSGLKEQISPVA